MSQQPDDNANTKIQQELKDCLKILRNHGTSSALYTAAIQTVIQYVLSNTNPGSRLPNIDVNLDLVNRKLSRKSTSKDRVEEVMARLRADVQQYLAELLGKMIASDNELEQVISNLRESTAVASAWDNEGKQDSASDDEARNRRKKRGPQDEPRDATEINDRDKRRRRQSVEHQHDDSHSNGVATIDLTESPPPARSWDRARPLSGDAPATDGSGHRSSVFDDKTATSEWFPGEQAWTAAGRHYGATTTIPSSFEKQGSIFFAYVRRPADQQQLLLLPPLVWPTSSTTNHSQADIISACASELSRRKRFTGMVEVARHLWAASFTQHTSPGSLLRAPLLHHGIKLWLSPFPAAPPLMFIAFIDEADGLSPQAIAVALREALGERGPKAIEVEQQTPTSLGRGRMMLARWHSSPGLVQFHVSVPPGGLHEPSTRRYVRFDGTHFNTPCLLCRHHHGNTKCEKTLAVTI